MRRGADIDETGLSTAGAGGGSRFVPAAAIPSARGQYVTLDLAARVGDSLARLVGPPCEIAVNRPRAGRLTDLGNRPPQSELLAQARDGHGLLLVLGCYQVSARGQRRQWGGAPNCEMVLVADSHRASGAREMHAYPHSAARPGLPPSSRWLSLSHQRRAPGERSVTTRCENPFLPAAFRASTRITVRVQAAPAT